MSPVPAQLGLHPAYYEAWSATYLVLQHLIFHDMITPCFLLPPCLAFYRRNLPRGDPAILVTN